MGSSGDTATLWKTDKEIKAGETLAEGEVNEAAARAVFEKAMASGRVPFALTGTGTEEKVDKFDPEVKEILFVAPIAGG